MYNKRLNRRQDEPFVRLTTRQNIGLRARNYHLISGTSASYLYSDTFALVIILAGLWRMLGCFKPTYCTILCVCNVGKGVSTLDEACGTRLIPRILGHLDSIVLS